MSYEERQKKENEAIKARKITVKLPEEDYERVIRNYEKFGIDESEMIEKFIGDMIARCGFAMFQKSTLLNHLLCEGYDPEDYLVALETIENDEDIKRDIEKHPPKGYSEKEIGELLQKININMDTWKAEESDMRKGWKPEKETNMDEELEIIKKWVKEKNQLLCR